MFTLEAAWWRFFMVENFPKNSNNRFVKKARAINNNNSNSWQSEAITRTQIGLPLLILNLTFQAVFFCNNCFEFLFKLWASVFKRKYFIFYPINLYIAVTFYREGFNSEKISQPKTVKCFGKKIFGSSLKTFQTTRIQIRTSYFVQCQSSHITTK